MSSAIFEALKAGLKADPAIAKKANGVFQFVLSKPASEWVVDCKAAEVRQGKAAKADVTLSMADADFVACVCSSGLTISGKALSGTKRSAKCLHAQLLMQPAQTV